MERPYVRRSSRVVRGRARERPPDNDCRTRALTISTRRTRCTQQQALRRQSFIGIVVARTLYTRRIQRVIIPPVQWPCFIASFSVLQCFFFQCKFLSFKCVFCVQQFLAFSHGCYVRYRRSAPQCVTCSNRRIIELDAMAIGDDDSSRLLIYEICLIYTE